MTESQKPTVGRAVHYLAPGSADGTFPPAHRAATVTDVRSNADGSGYEVRLCVMNPTGIFFSDWLAENPTAQRPISWHWPERE